MRQSSERATCGNSKIPTDHIRRVCERNENVASGAALGENAGMNTRLWVALFAGAMVALTTGCPQKRPQEKILTVEPRAEITAERDALLVTGTGAAPADRAGGQGRLMAQAAAKYDAMRQLAAVVGDFRMKSTASGAQINIEGFVKGAQEVKTDYDSASGIARVTLRMPLNGMGGVANALGYDRILVANTIETQKKP